MARPVRTKEQLRKASEHLVYEVRMVEKLVATIEAQDKGALLGDAAIESFLVHARLVAHFVGWNRGQTKPDDVIAEDFMAGWTPTVAPAEINADVTDKMNKRIAHLSYLREHAAVDKHFWDFSAIAIALLNRVGDFARTAPRDSLNSDLWNPWKAEHDISLDGGASGPFKHSIPTGVRGATGGYQPPQ